jgi:tRNA threonylcarbamoyladenosine biosynthesis protein TsaE
MPDVFVCKHVDELGNIAARILNLFPDERIFIFRGELGAGKTTLIKAFCKELNVSSPTNSPSFAIINEYTTSDSLKLYHFDFYRVKKLEEVYDIGYEEYFFNGNYCFIEWPEIIEDILPKQYLEIKIEWDLSNDSRSISLLKNSG